MYDDSFEATNMDEDAGYIDDSYDESTQPQTQSTQQASQPTSSALDNHLWGYLQPCSSALTRIDFWKLNPRYTIGRNTELNQVVLPGFKISNTHCVLVWDGQDEKSGVVVQDLSSNGTFINGVKIGKGHTRILNDGNELAFGTTVPQLGNGGLEDYRFIYRHTANGVPPEGLYAHYDISTELGKGSFAKVMKAICRETGKWYAVKMIHGKSLRNSGQTAEQQDEQQKNFTREIVIMERMKHPNICELKEFFVQDDGAINLVLELVDGGDLLEYIIKNNGLSEVDSKHITYQICDALSYIHSQDVTHRDLKPENVLLTSHNPPIVKVADFGLAKMVDSVTMLRTMCGTPSYLAPEVVNQVKEEGYDNLVDSWSVGVIVFAMLTNSAPFIEDTRQRDIRLRISERKVDWTNLTGAGVSIEGSEFIHLLLEENPQERMSLTDALHHAWLKSYIPVYDRVTLELLSSSANGTIGVDDIAKLPAFPGSTPSGISHHLQGLQIQPAVPTPGQPTPIAREPPSSFPLQRRSHLISEAAEGNGQPLPEPSSEMLAHALQDQALQEHGPTSSKKKRAHAELSALPEEGQAADNGSRGEGSSGAQTARRSGRHKAARRT